MSTSQEKGKRGELFVFQELLKKGADLYLPLIDTGVDAVVRRRDGKYVGIQIKTTEATEQAGWFNVYDIQERLGHDFYIICVDMSKNPPETWVLPVKEFHKYATVSHTKDGDLYDLPINTKSRKHSMKSRRDLLRKYYQAWDLLT